MKEEKVYAHIKQKKKSQILWTRHGNREAQPPWLLHHSMFPNSTLKALPKPKANTAKAFAISLQRRFPVRAHTSTDFDALNS